MVEAKAKSLSQSFLERDTLEGDSPVGENDMQCSERVGSPRLEA